MTKNFIQQSYVEDKGYSEHGKSRTVVPYRLSESIEPTFGQLKEGSGVNRSNMHSSIAWDRINRNIPEVPESSIWYLPTTFEDLMTTPLPPRPMIFPWLPERGFGMVHSWRGGGKSFFLLGLAHAAATGGEFLGWSVDRPRMVLFLDGEMSYYTVRERLLKMFGHRPMTQNLYFLIDSKEPHGITKLDTPEGREAMDDLIKGFEGLDLLILDNLSCLLTGDENDSNSWVPFMNWVLKLRRQGVTVLVAHHSGKNGDQRGICRREDAMDSVIKLKHPEGYKVEQGCRFIVEFEKCRDHLGEDAKPFEARLVETEEGLDWLISTSRNKRNMNDEVISMSESGKSVRVIAEELNISKSKVDRIIQKGKSDCPTRCPTLSHNALNSVPESPHPLKGVGGGTPGTKRINLGTENKFVDRGGNPSYLDRNGPPECLVHPDGPNQDHRSSCNHG